jgi:hypothetical protein
MPLYATSLASPNNVTSISNWLSNAQNALLDKEAAYISMTQDLVQLVPKSITPLRQLLEQSTSFRLSKLWAKKPPDLPVRSNTHPETAL